MRKDRYTIKAHTFDSNEFIISIIRTSYIHHKQATITCATHARCNVTHVHCNAA